MQGLPVATSCGLEFLINKPRPCVWNLVLPLFVLALGLSLTMNGISLLTVERVAAIWIIWGLLAEGQSLIRTEDGRLILRSTSLTIPDENFLRDNARGIKRFAAFAPGTGLFLIILGTLLSVL
jgi:hypothetical protein